MSLSIWLWLGVSVSFMLAFIILLFLGIRRKNMNMVIVANVLFFVGIMSTLSTAHVINDGKMPPVPKRGSKSMMPADTLQIEIEKDSNER